MDRIRTLAAPEVKIERVKVADYLAADLSSEKAIDEALAKLRQRLIELLQQGVRIVLE